MKVFHVVKTPDGARWAALQAIVAAEAGVEVHVAVPSDSGNAIPIWEQSGAQLHIIDASLPTHHPWEWPQRATAIRGLVDDVAPDLIHSHFVTTTLALRRALGRRHPIPRLFQVPGPLHMQHRPSRTVDVWSAGKNDFWIASSRYIQGLYWCAGVDPNRLFLSYYGSSLVPRQEAGRSGAIRRLLNLPVDSKIVGNISYMYPPKYVLGQHTGLKRHEDVIDAIAMVCQRRSDVVGVIIGSQWGGGTSYRERLRRRALEKAGDRIHFVDAVQFADVPELWADYDCAVHLPMSENCGGVIEPLAAFTPTVASRVGALPEVIMDRQTGWLVPARSPVQAADRIEEVLSTPDVAHRVTKRGCKLVADMFDYRRTGMEIVGIYRFMLGLESRWPTEFDSSAHLQALDIPSPAEPFS